METGSWKINVGEMPQKVATAFSKFQEELVGVKYEFIAYLGSQVVNGTNHAVLAKQILTFGKESENVVILIFNEKPNNEAILVNIERVVESGLALGGIHINVQKELNEELLKVWNSVFEVYVGPRVTPIAFLGTQTTNGIKYLFAVVYSLTVISDEVNQAIYSFTTVCDKVDQIMIATINPSNNSVKFTDILQTKYEASF